MFFTEKSQQHLIFLLYLFISFFTIYFHEPWGDEAQAWLIARDASLEQMYDLMKYEGTPALWHLILIPFARLDMPYFSMHLIHWLFAVGIIYLFVYHSPFSILLKFSFSFSYFMTYEYLAKARNYNISILLLFILAILYNKRFQRPLLYAIFIALLCQTNLMSLAAAFALSLVFFIDFCLHFSKLPLSKWLYILCFVIIGISGLLAFLQIYPPQSATHVPRLNHPIVLSVQTSYEHYPTLYDVLVFFEETGYNTLNMILVILVLVAVQQKSINCFLLISWLFAFITQTLLPTLNFRHMGFYLIFSIVALWLKFVSNDPELFQNLAERYKKYACRLAAFICIFSMPLAFEFIRSDYVKPYSGAKETAEYILENHLDAFEIIGLTRVSIQAVLPYFPKEKKLWYPHLQDYGTFITWDKRFTSHRELAFEDFLKIIDEKKALPTTAPAFDFANSPILSPGLPDSCMLVLGMRRLQHHRLKLLYRNSVRALSFENYFLYLLYPSEIEEDKE